MAVDYGALRPVNVLGAFEAGMERGRETKRQAIEQSALAAFAQNPNDPEAINALAPVNPMLAMKLQDRQREQQRIEARRAVFAPQGAMTPGVPGMTSDGAPASLVDPSALPPRTDGLQINQEALRNLYQFDPEGVMEIQKTIYNADKTAVEQFKARGEVMATAAYRLSRLPAEQRATELQAMAPQLQGLGIDSQTLAKADLTDAGLQRYMTLGRSISDVMKEDDAKYVTIPAGGTLVNVRDPKAVAAVAGGGAAPIQPGAVVNGKTFKGGDYRDPNNWSGGAASSTPATFPR